MTDAQVTLWGSNIGAVSWDSTREVAVFQYDPAFVGSGIQVAPLMMPLRELPYEFPALNRETFWGLPGLLADSLPDKFGNAIIDAWLAAQGRTRESFNPVERLCYVGSRGMGALEFRPALLEPTSSSKTIEVASLVELSNKILQERSNLHWTLNGVDDQTAVQDILRVGTSAGGARAKAILAWNPRTNEFRSGQVNLPPGFEHWIIKFDGIQNNKDKELADPQGYGKIEYAYARMALKAGIEMSECRLFAEGGRSHFMTRRFDRGADGSKVHMQSLCGLAHIDFNTPAIFSYEETLQVMKRLGLPRTDLEQQVRRAMFNVVGRNQDDHPKNIAFLMNKSGEWRLSPAFDISYSYSPGGYWTRQHQMSLNGKRDGFTREDMLALARLAGIKPRKAADMLEQVISAVKTWPQEAADAGVEENRIEKISAVQRIRLS
ncbi:MAG: type II toxin-antitoxin system HipA family toxin [Anaerolineaceae bacterium]|nr:type II toxin-antitoxin system HipA family toxin [Anaerolineaceae bacterium]